MKVPDPARWALLSPQLDELLDLEPDARAKRLTALRAEDPKLADELTALLSGPESPGGVRFLAQTAFHEAPSLAGQRLGAYTLEAPLGQGGTGTVWQARRDDGRFEGAVAIKLLHLSLLGQAGAERFSREGSILARLTHPNIARLLDAGLTDGGQPYLVIELVRGERLDRHCQARGLSVDQRLALFSDVLAAVAHAHSHLVIHRDIKPSNIMVTPDGVVKLLDFGIAKLVAEGGDGGSDGLGSPSTDLTREWGRAMTPEYAAPEQLRGEAVTTATDVYALGVLLYELLSGQLPGQSPKRGTGAARPLSTAMSSDAVSVRPSLTVTDAALRRRLSGDLDTIILRAMKLDIAERYPTVSAMRDDLARHLSGHPVLARADSTVYRVRKFVGRHKAACAVLAGVALALLGGAYAQVAVLLALAAGTLLALWQAKLAREQANLARAAQQRAEAVKKFIASIFTEATPREGVGGVVTAIDLLTSAMGRVETELSASPAVAGELGVLIARSCSQLGDPPLGARAVNAALPRLQAAFGSRHVLTLQARSLQLESYNQLGDYDAAQAVAGPLVADLRQLLPTHAELLIDALRETSYVMAKRGDAAASFAPLHEAIAVGEAHLGPAHAETLETIGLLSNTCNHFGLYTEALEAADTAMQRAHKSFGAQRPHTLLASVERWYADALVRTGRPKQAEAVARQVVTDQRALDGEVTLRVVNAMTAHSVTLLGLGRLTEAIALSREVVAQHARLFKTPTVDTAAFQARLAACLAPTRRTAEVEAVLDAEAALWTGLPDQATHTRLRRERVRALARAWNGDAVGAQTLIDTHEASMRTAVPLEWLRLARVRALNLRMQMRWVEAITAAQDAVARCDADEVKGIVLAQDRAHALTELSLSLLGQGDTAAADTQLALAERQYALSQVEPSVLVTDALLGRGRLHLLAGRTSDALACFEVAERCWAEAHPQSVWHVEALAHVDQARHALR
jgi:eukaryotic-like serine/threonine-protein kinase